MVDSHFNRETDRVFVGRQREMSELLVALEDTMSGHGRLVMLVGEPGIGKTRTAQELASLAEQRGGQVLWGRCFEEGGAPPYWPWVQTIRSYVQRASAEQLATEMGPGDADIAEIVPEINGKLPDLETPPVLEPEQSRFRLFDSIATFMKKAAERQPMMLVLDDLHWADRSSLLSLEFLVRETGTSRLLLAGTYRDVEVSRRHPLSQTLGALVREQLFQRVQLDGLTQQEVGELVGGSAGFTLPVEAAEIIHKRTDGNPFFVGEVTRQVTPDNIAEGQGWVSIVPEGVRDAIGRRLNRLSEQCNQMLITASIIGRQFTLAQLNPHVRDPSGGSEQVVTVDRLLEVVEEALGTGLIEELPEPGGRYQFTHALIQETLMEEISITRRVRLHARIGEALEQLYGAEAETHAAELAHHFSQAEAELGTEKLVRYSLLAGERALAAYAWEEALGYFQRALAAKEGLAMDSETAAVLYGLGRAQVATFDRHQRPEAEASLSRAFDYYAEIGDALRAVAIAETPMFDRVGESTVLTQIISRALDLVPPDSIEAGCLLARHGSLLGMEESDYDASQKAFSHALTIAQNLGDVALEVRTLANASQVYWHHGRGVQETAEAGLRAIELAGSIDDPRHEAMARYYTSMSLRGSGDVEGARRHATALLALAERLRDRQVQMNAFHANQYLCLIQGDWDSARGYIDAGLALSPNELPLLVGRVALEYEAGDFGQGRAYLDRFLEALRLNPPGPTIPYAMMASVIPIVARISGVMGQFDIAQEAADVILSSPSAAPGVVGMARTGLALMSVQRGDVSAAETLYSYLDPLRGRMLVTRTASDRILGFLSQTMGNLVQAVDHFEASLVLCRKGGYRPELAWTCCDYADCLLQRSAPGDRVKARSLLEESLSISAEVGMRPLMERAKERLEQIEAQPVAAPAYPDGLSQREVEVLQLIAAGKTNLQISEDLVIAEGTARRHVANIYEKIGAVNRAEATRYALRESLLSLDETQPAGS